jgi:LacI family transcriptional regulator
MGKITIKRLAEELNLSTSTISRSLQDSYEISLETKQRVWTLAEKLNYVPNHYASGLRSKKSKTIAVVIPEVADSYFSQAINGIEAVAQDNGYHVLIYLTHESVLKEQAILKDFQCGRVDGVLMSITSETVQTHHIQELIAKEIPLVFFDRVCEEIETAKITTDDFKSSYQATQHLIERGCKKIALLSVSKSLSISNLRMEGYRKALSDYAISFSESDMVLCTHDEEHNLVLIKELMQNKARPDGMIATVEKLTTSIYLACHELGLSIPQDVKVVGFSNLQSALILNPSLTTITQPAFEMGKAAASLLFKALGKKPFHLKTESLVIPSSLHIRNSTQ